jgi:hypothetical protein
VSTIEQPQQSYYPSARVTMTVRFDDPLRRKFNRIPPGQPITLAYGKAKPAVKASRPV